MAAPEIRSDTPEDVFAPQAGEESIVSFDSAITAFFTTYHIGKTLDAAAESSLTLISKSVKQFDNSERAVSKILLAFSIQKIMLRQIQVCNFESEQGVLDVFYPLDDPLFHTSFNHSFFQVESQKLAQDCREKLSYFLQPYHVALRLYSFLKDDIGSLDEAKLSDLYAPLGKYFKDHRSELSDYLPEILEEGSIEEIGKKLKAVPSSYSDQAYGEALCHIIARHGKPELASLDEQLEKSISALAFKDKKKIKQAILRTVDKTELRFFPKRFPKLAQKITEKLISRSHLYDHLVTEHPEKIRLSFPFQHLKPALVLSDKNFELLEFLPAYTDAVLEVEKSNFPLKWFAVDAQTAEKFVQVDYSFDSEPDAEGFSSFLQQLPNLTRLNVRTQLGQKQLQAIAKVQSLAFLSLKECRLPQKDDALAVFTQLKSLKRVDLAKTEVTAAQIKALLAPHMTIDLHLEECKRLKQEELKSLQSSTDSLLFA